MPENASGSTSSVLSGTPQVHDKVQRSAASQPMRVPPKVPRWQRVTHPPGALTATLLIGLAGAVLIPLDRPGIGWFLAAAIAVGAIYAVDRNARKALTRSPEPPAAEQLPGPTAAEVTSNRGGDGSTPVPQPSTAPTDGNEASIWGNPATRDTPAPTDKPASSTAFASGDVPAVADRPAAGEAAEIRGNTVTGSDRVSGDVPPNRGDTAASRGNAIGGGPPNAPGHSNGE
ncbi:hypothetical protein [Nocardia brasiliensis]|uniref:hypothetical protein n=1 Tax=Nocardia brasiliensis TaxID=37326 RepID=UPI002457EFAB|nr:hypothetical protein [Nocardia brasiliensis]